MKRYSVLTSHLQNNYVPSSDAYVSINFLREKMFKVKGEQSINQFMK